jgi:hypothetical protein
MHKFTLSLTYILVFTQENAVVIHAIVGWKSSIGRWSRVQASSEICLSEYDIFVDQENVLLFSFLFLSFISNLEKRNFSGECF